MLSKHPDQYLQRKCTVWNLSEDNIKKLFLDFNESWQSTRLRLILTPIVFKIWKILTTRSSKRLRRNLNPKNLLPRNLKLIRILLATWRPRLKHTKLQFHLIKKLLIIFEIHTPRRLMVSKPKLLRLKLSQTKN